MSIADSDPSTKLAQQPSSAGGPPEIRRPLAIWLNGDVLACNCPQCHAPMSIRLWLLLADCWRCGTSIQLTEEQEQEAKRLLAQRPANFLPTNLPPALPATRSAAPPMLPPIPALPAAVPLAALVKAPSAFPLPAIEKPQAVKSTRTVEPPPLAVPVPSTEASEPPPTPESLRGAFTWLRDLPAWLVSLVLHLVAFLLMGLYFFEPEAETELLILSTAIHETADPGDAPLVPTDPDQIADSPIAPIEPTEAEDDPFVPEPMNTSPLVSTGDVPGELTEPILSPAMLEGPAEIGDLLKGRGSTSRHALLIDQGGNENSEAAVALGLKWLAAHQHYDGHWSLNQFNLTGDCKGQCTALGTHANDVAATALALLPFLGAGQTHKTGDYKSVVANGLRWLREQEGEDGDLRGLGNSTMYAQGQAAIVLCEAYGLTRDRFLKEPAQKAIDYIVSAQHSQGGWRYKPDEPGDTSVVGWQIMALRSAQMAYLDVPPDVFKKAGAFLDSVQSGENGELYLYMPGSFGTPAMTAEGLLCRQYSGWARNEPRLVKGVHWLLEQAPPAANQTNMYYWYYATQVMHHMGGEEWKAWNGQMRDMLVSLQETKGHEAGSWTPRQYHDPAGGRLYMTALAICTLEVYYRHLPLYRDGAPQGLSASHAKPRRAKPRTKN